MKKLGLVCFASMISAVLFAQNDPFFSHYMFNRPFYNPAAVGEEEVASISFQHRSQWLGYGSSFDGSGGAPNTQLLSAALPVKSFISGLGLNVVNDNLGPVNNFSLYVPISYSVSFLNGNLSLGVSPGIFFQDLGDEFRANDPSDPLIPSGGQTQTNIDFGAGLFYSSSQNWYLGFAAQNILEPSFDFGQAGLENAIATSYNGIVGFSRVLTRDLILSPSVLVRSNLETFTFDFNAILDYKRLAWGGLSFRRGEAIIFLVGYSFLKERALKVGYALDYVVDQQEAKQPTSHEFFVRYNVPNLIFGGRKQIKTPRYTY